jgi:two-component system sensor histidine kinase/response regulator
MNVEWFVYLLIVIVTVVAVIFWLRYQPSSDPSEKMATKGLSLDKQQGRSAAQIDEQMLQSWQLLLRVSKDGLLLIDSHGEILDLNQQALLFLGADATVGSIVFPFFRANFAEKFAEFCLTPPSENAQSLELTDVGLFTSCFTNIHVSVKLSAMAYSTHSTQVRFVLCLSQYDVEFAQRAHQSISESIKDTLLQSNVSAIIAIDQHDRIVEFNPCAERLFGYARSQILGKTMGDILIPPAYRPHHYAGLNRFITTGKTTIMQKRIEISALNSQGQEFPIEIEVSPLRREQEWLFIAVIHDITERKHSVDKMEIALQEAKDANQTKSRFLTSVSHEIRTPLHGMLSLLECLQHTALNDQQYQYINLAQSAGSNLLNLVNDVLDLSRVEAGKREVHCSEFNPRALLEQHLEIYRPRISEKGLALYLNESPDVPNRIFSDITIINQILSNLLNNAYQYTDHGSITVSSGWTSSAEQPGGYWFCKIEDTGIGFSKEQLKFLFSEFTRFSQDNNAQGTGVGLMISLELAKLLGGTLTVASELGAGAVFTLSIPAPQRLPRRRFRQLTQLSVYLLSTQKVWLSCLRQQLAAVGVTQVTDIQQSDLAHLAKAAIVIVDAENSLSAQTFAPDVLCQQNPTLKFITSGTDVHPAWLQRPEHYAFLCQPYRQQDVVRALRGAMRNIHWQWITNRRAQPTMLLTPPTSKQTYHVLLVDDSEVNRLTVKTFLGLEGIKVSEAANGEEAVWLVRQHVFDLILMDMRMPVLGGLAATQQIREQHLADQTPVIALTAHVQEEERQQCLAMGMQDFLTKPISKSQLLKHVMYWLKKNNEVDAPVKATKPQEQLQHDSFEHYPVLDAALLTQFKADLTEEIYQRLLSIFLSEIVKQCKEVQLFIEQQKFERVEILVHALKSSALTFGAVQLSEIAKAAELACRKGDFAKAVQYCQYLSAVVELTINQYSRSSNV